VTIPPLGESITDGTVAAVLKKVGDPVEEDEPIVQIETDKVTIDVRAPRAGVIEAILVRRVVPRGAARAAPPAPRRLRRAAIARPSEPCARPADFRPAIFLCASPLQVRQDDNVNVGHVVASIAEGAAAGSVEGSPAPAASPKQGQAPHQAPAAAPPAQQPGQPPLQAAAPAAAATPPPPPPPLPPSGHARISFPPRRTPSGEVISMLPAAAAAEALRRAAAAAAGPRSDSAEPSAEHSFLARLRAAAAARAPQVPRQQISDWEMERIMLGGADP
jgi:2-oxoglutarate dehydrogenase E2 component (dihydrolipoamide succinyltransferase)